MEYNKVFEAHYYELLGLSPNSSLEQCEQRYREKLIELHPDRFPLETPQRQEAENKLKELHSALERIRHWKLSVLSELTQEEKEARTRQEKLNRLTVEVRTYRKK